VTTAEVLGLTIPAATSKSAQADAVDIGQLVHTYSAVLFRVAHSILRNRSEADDVVQEVFVRVLEHQARLPEVREMRV
jgi:RNA polymerase sigma-70 factor (ECF subfamily)